MLPSEWIAELKVDDLPEPYHSIAKIVGIEKAFEIAQTLGGISFYFAKPEALLRDLRDRRIRAEFNGQNFRQLATKYNLTEVWIRSIVRGEGGPDGPVADLPGQLRLDIGA